MKLSPRALGVAAFLVMFPCLSSETLLAQDATGDPLARYRDKNRVLLLFAPTEHDGSYQAQSKLWQGEEAGFKDRQLVVLPLLADGKPDTPAVLGKRFGVDPHTFHVVLVGKDGHDAYQSQRPVTAEAIFQRIDAMPMRREEMRRQQADQ